MLFLLCKPPELWEAHRALMKKKTMLMMKVLPNTPMLLFLLLLLFMLLFQFFLCCCFCFNLLYLGEKKECLLFLLSLWLFSL